MVVGKVVSVKGQIIEVEFNGEKPEIYDVLVFREDQNVKMEVYTSASPNSFYCLALSEIGRAHV